ncbi:hypothetical protein [Larkinella harenae]
MISKPTTTMPTVASFSWGLFLFSILSFFCLLLFKYETSRKMKRKLRRILCATPNRSAGIPVYEPKAGQPLYRPVFLPFQSRIPVIVNGN